MHTLKTGKVYTFDYFFILPIYIYYLHIFTYILLLKFVSLTNYFNKINNHAWKSNCLITIGLYNIDVRYK